MTTMMASSMHISSAISSKEESNTPSALKFRGSMEFALKPRELLLCGLIPVLVYLYMVKNRANMKKKMRRTPPAPEGAWPVIGHLRLLGTVQLLHRTLGAMADKYGPVFAIRLGSNTAIVISSQDTARECFTINDKVFSTRPRPLPVKLIGYDQYNFGFASYGPYWRELRKMAMTQLLSVRRLELSKHIRDMEVNCLLEGLFQICKEKGGPALVEMKAVFGDLAVNIILRSVTGNRYNRADPESRRCRKVFHDFDRLLGINYFSDAFPALWWMDVLNGSVRQLKEAAKEIDYFLSKWVKEHRQKRPAGDIKERDQDFIDIMLSVLDDGRPAQDVDLVTKATCVTLMGAGSDTTVITLTWALSLLLNNPKALKKAQEELDTHVGNHRQVDESDIKNLAYLQAIIKETLRLYPAAPLSVPREAMEDCTIAGFDVPKGTQLFVNLWKLHHDPSVWKNPSEFIPERFLEEHSDLDVKGQNFEYLPFGSGRRMCPGVSFGYHVLHLALARLLHAFELSAASGKLIDMTEGPGMTLPKETPLEVLVTPKSPGKLYVC